MNITELHEIIQAKLAGKWTPAPPDEAGDRWSPPLGDWPSRPTSLAPMGATTAPWDPPGTLASPTPCPPLHLQSILMGVAAASVAFAVILTGK